MHWVDKAAAQIAVLTPKSGYNLVGIDVYEPPGEELFLIERYETREEAERAKAEHERDHRGVIVHVYGPASG